MSHAMRVDLFCVRGPGGLPITRLGFSITDKADLAGDLVGGDGSRETVGDGIVLVYTNDAEGNVVTIHFAIGNRGINNLAAMTEGGNFSSQGGAINSQGQRVGVVGTTVAAGGGPGPGAGNIRSLNGGGGGDKKNCVSEMFKEEVFFNFHVCVFMCLVDGLFWLCVVLY